MKYPKFLPYPSSFLNAFLLLLLAALCAGIIEYIFKIPLDPRPTYVDVHTSVIASLVIVIVPTLLITFVHHCIHVFLSKFIPNSQASYMFDTKGFMPGIVSWWEGFLGCSILLFTLILVGGTEYVINRAWWLSDEAFVFISWLVASYFYQLTYLAEEEITTIKKTLTKRP